MSAKCALKGRKSKLFSLVTILGAVVWLTQATLHPPLPTKKSPARLYATQLRDDLKRVYLQAIESAKQSIHLQIYGLTDPEILASLRKRKKEGLKISIFYDPKASKKLPKDLIAIPIACKGLMHRKILITDEERLFVGTANFTTQSLKMHDNLVLGLYSPTLAKALVEEKSFPDKSLEIFYLPDLEGIALAALETLIDNAKKTVRVAMFTLTHPKLVDKLCAASRRGVDVAIAVDRYTARGASRKSIELCQKAGIPIYKSRGNQLLHHKWVLIDGKTLAMGSANWTRSAFEKNQDCLLILNDLSPKLKKRLHRLWKAVAIASEKG